MVMNVVWTYEAAVIAQRSELADMMTWLSANIQKFDIRRVAIFDDPYAGHYNIMFYDLSDAAKFKMFFGGDDE